MVLAAGYGTRMRPLTLQKPKPLLEVGGRSMLDHALDRLAAIGIRRVVVNVHYLAEPIEAHLAKRTDLTIILSREDEILDTGGGIKNALHHFDGLPFFALNADLPWIDAAEPSLQKMATTWDAARMDAFVLLMPTAKARGFSPTGDFAMEPDGRVHRADITPPRPFVFIGAQILHPQLFASVPQRMFSNNILWNDAEARNRLYGIEHRGTCYHVGTPEDWREANALLDSGRGWGVV